MRKFRSSTISKKKRYRGPKEKDRALLYEELTEETKYRKKWIIKQDVVKRR